MSIARLLGDLKEQGIKIRVQDDNLKISAPEGKLTPMMVSQIKSRKAEIIEFFKKHAQEEDGFTAIAATEKREYYPLSPGQKRLFIVHTMAPGSTTYNMPNILEMLGTPDLARLESAIFAMIQRHESFRTSFHMVDSQAVQRIHPMEDITFQVKRLSMLDSDHHPASQLIAPFDLAQAPLLRAAVLERGEGLHPLLMIDIHHIISDGTSMSIFTRELLTLYAQHELPPLRIQYKDYAVWQGSMQRKAIIKKQEEFWLQLFAGEVPLLNMPTDYPRPPIQSFSGVMIKFEIEERYTGELKTIARKENTTLYMVLLAIYNILLYKVTSQEDIIVGTPTAGRPHADLHDIIGMFVNTLALRNYPAAHKTYREFLREVNQVTLEAFDNQDYPFEELVEAIGIARDTARNPLFDTLFALQNIGNPQLQDFPLEMKHFPYERGVAKFDLAMDIFEEGDKLLGKIDYSTACFKRETAQRLIDYYKEIVTSVTANPDRQLWEIEILPQAEKERLLYEFNNTAVKYPGDRSIQDIFTEQAKQSPDRIALARPSGEGTAPQYLAYRELAELSDRQALALINQGVVPGDIVAVMAIPSFDTIVALLAILKAGAAYLPIDPDYPEERKQYILNDSAARIFITQHPAGAPSTPSATKVIGEKGHRLEKTSCSGNSPKYTGELGSVRDLKERSSLSMIYQTLTPVGACPPSPSKLSAANLAYIIYTSGSTGRPKGVMVEHRGVVRLVKNNNFIEFRPGRKLLATGALVFDISTLEVWGPLLNGLTLYQVDKSLTLEPAKLRDAVLKNNIDILHLIPQLFNQVIETYPDTFAQLEYFLVGGDQVRPAPVFQLRALYEHLKIVHCYGPTENTTFSTTYPVEKDHGEKLPIGKPINNSTAYVIDKYGRLQPIGIPGELCVGGDGLARGYLNNPELTAEKFAYKSRRLAAKQRNRSFDQTFSKVWPPAGPPEAKTYQTGDLCRWLPDGNLEFLGREDTQVKIRGVRIECGEIERRLMEHEAIKEAVVIAHEDQTREHYLCAYLVLKSGLLPDQGETMLNAFRDFLSGRLPVYMIPSYFVLLDEIPLNPNGKVDKKKLPLPGIGTKAAEYVAPRNFEEETLAQLWSEVLGIEKEKIGIDDDFFNLGGHSLKATVMAGKISKRFNIEITLAEIFRNPTIRSLASIIGMVDWVGNEEDTPDGDREEVIL